MVQDYSDEDLIKQVKDANSSEAMEELMSRHGGLFTKIVKHYSPNLMSFSGICFRDIIDERMDILYQCVKSFNPEKNAKFHTWFGNQVKFFCLNSLNNNGKKFEISEPQSLNAFIDSIISYTPSENYEEESKIIFDILRRHSDKRLEKIFYMRFFMEKPYSSFNHIAKQLGLSVQGTINLYHKALKYLQENCSLLEK